MKFQQRTFDQIVGAVTMQSDEYLEPIMDTLRDWDDSTEVLRGDWTDFALEATDGRLTLDGRPFHPYTERRLIRYVMGVTRHKSEFWRDNPDLMADALHRAPTLRANDVQVRVVNGEVVYVTDLQQDLGSHLEFYEPMLKAFRKSLAQTKVPMSLVGYIVDPVWVHARILYLPDTDRPHQVGAQFDANYLFSRTTRGRASLGLFGYHLLWESTLTMDNWWSIRTLGLKSNTRDAIPENFAKRLKNGGPDLRREATQAVSALSRQAVRNAASGWRQDLVSTVGRKFAGTDKTRKALIELDQSGKNSRTDAIFALAKAMKSLPFDRRVLAERDLSRRLKEIS